MKVQGSSVKLRLLPNTSDSGVECRVSIEAARTVLTLVALVVSPEFVNGYYSLTFDDTIRPAG